MSIVSLAIAAVVVALALRVGVFSTNGQRSTKVGWDEWLLVAAFGGLQAVA